MVQEAQPWFGVLYFVFSFLGMAFYLGSARGIHFLHVVTKEELPVFYVHLPWDRCGLQENLNIVSDLNLVFF